MTHTAHSDEKAAIAGIDATRAQQGECQSPKLILALLYANGYRCHAGR